MDSVNIKATSQTPAVTLDKEKGVFQIEGRSLPEDAIEFYAPVLKWLDGYRHAPNDTTILEFKFEYINTTSVKVIQQILSSFEGVNGVIVKWYSGEDDEDIEDLGRQFAEIQRLSFEFVGGG